MPENMTCYLLFCALVCDIFENITKFEHSWYSKKHLKTAYKQIVSYKIGKISKVPVEKPTKVFSQGFKKGFFESLLLLR